MTPLLEWVSSTWLATAVRESSNVFVYPTILAFHTLGLAFVVGISTAIALRAFGVAPDMPLAPLKRFLPVMWIGFLINAVSGVLLLLIEPEKFLYMTDFYLKLAAIAGAIVCMRLLLADMFRDPARVAAGTVSKRGRILGGTAVALWAAAITTGRLTAYDDATAQRQTGLATLIVALVLLAVVYIVARLLDWNRAARRNDARMTAR